MIDAKMLATKKEDETVSVFGVWIPRRGDNAIFTIEVIDNFGAFVTAEVYQKNYDEVGDGTATGTTMTFDQTTGRQSITRLGSKELVRIKLTVERGGLLSPTEVGMFLFRFLEPVWFEAVKP